MTPECGNVLHEDDLVRGHYRPEKEIPLFYWAVICNYVALVAFLISVGARPVHGHYWEGRSPLHVACDFGYEAIAKMLLQYLDDQKGHHHLIITASDHGHTQIVKLLLDNGVSANATNAQDDRALNVAALNGHSSIVQLLIDRGANLEHIGSNSFTALMNACRHGRDACILILLEAGAMIVPPKLFGHGTSFHIALVHNRCSPASIALLASIYLTRPQPMLTSKIERRTGSLYFIMKGIGAIFVLESPSAIFLCDKNLPEGISIIDGRALHIQDRRVGREDPTAYTFSCDIAYETELLVISIGHGVSPKNTPGEECIVHFDDEHLVMAKGEFHFFSFWPTSDERLLKFYNGPMVDRSANDTLME